MANKNHKKIHYVTSAIFGLIALLHLWRAVYQVPAKLGEWDAPVWLSWVGVVVALVLAVLLWKSAE